MTEVEPATLPDLLREGLDVVFVGINPSLYSVAQGHYFARRINRFWPCFSRSILSENVRRAVGLELLTPAHDSAMPEHGFGFTDLVKRPSARAAELIPGELVAGAAILTAKLKRYRPRIACVHGVTIYRPIARALAVEIGDLSLGLQPHRIGGTALFVVPNPSPANAHFTPAQQVEWYDRLAEYRAGLR